jgi:hypothetical protein
MSDLYEVKKRNNETEKQFKFRKNLYNEIYDDLNSNKDIKEDEVSKKALIYSNMWINILSLNCSYPDEVMELIHKYKPSDKDNIYK